MSERDDPKNEAQALREQIETLRASIEREPGDASAHYGLGRAQAKLGEHDEATRSFARASELRADYTAAFREWGRSAMALGDVDAAAHAFEQGLEAAERSGDLQTAREIRVFLKRIGRGPSAPAPSSNEPDEANAAVEAPPPSSPEALTEARGVYAEGFRHFAKGELTQAIEIFRRALEIAPSLSIAWNGLSMALGQAGQLDEAVDAANTLVALEPEDPLSHTNLSRLLMQRGQIPEAEDARAKAMQLQMRQAR